MKPNTGFFMLVAEIIVYAVVDALFYVIADRPLNDSATYTFVFMNFGFLLAFLIPLLAPKPGGRLAFSRNNVIEVAALTIVEAILGAAFIVAWDSALYSGILQALVVVIWIVAGAYEYRGARGSASAVAAGSRGDVLREAKGNMKDALQKASPEMRPAVSKAHDEVMAIPVEATASTAAADDEIRRLTADVLEAVTAGDAALAEDLCGKLSAKVAERDASDGERFRRVAPSCPGAMPPRRRL